MQKWEYNYFKTRNDTELIETLNKLGRQGWEVASSHCEVYPDGDGLCIHHIIFKRPIQG